MFYKDVTEEITFEPIVKAGTLLLRIFHKGKLVATINYYGIIQRQSPKEWKIFWDAGALVVLKKGRKRKATEK